MKRILLIIPLILACLWIALPASAADKGPRIEFETKTHDFGTIREKGGKVSCSFKFTNTGAEPLVILTAKASCGCTKPAFPDEPIAPGQSGTIDVTFNPRHQMGELHKNVTVTTNDRKNRKVVLKITGLVVE